MDQTLFYSNWCYLKN